MKRTLLLIQGDEDVAALPLCAQILKSDGTRLAWILYSPAIACNQKAAAAEFDKELDELTRRKNGAKERDDFTAAAGFADQIRRKEQDRHTAIRNAWKSVAKDERERALDAIFNPFREALNPGNDPQGVGAKVTEMDEHYNDGDALECLLSQKKVWPVKPMPFGGFRMVWARQLAEYAVAPAAKCGPPPESDKSTPTAPPVKAPASRLEELQALRFFDLKGIAGKLSVPVVKGMGMRNLINLILAAEDAKKAA